MPSSKPDSYYANIRWDIVDLLQSDSNYSILELGCGEGFTGREILKARKAIRYTGIELDENSANIAKTFLSEVIVGDVSNADLSGHIERHDVLILSEVVEHLQEPWSAVARLMKCVKIGGLVFASSPNIAHWRIITRLVTGNFDYEDSGVMDDTHLRWFTPKTYRELFTQAGVEVSSVHCLNKLGLKGMVFNALTFGAFKHLIASQMMLIGKRRR
jgi:2-polyprenyl-3-methyl-5-hydroxy-6-metoxy-1,4-benzoquinol methylase